MSYYKKNFYKKLVRPKIGNREKYQGKHGKYSKKLGKHYMKHEETHGEMGGHVGNSH